MGKFSELLKQEAPQEPLKSQKPVIEIQIYRSVLETAYTYAREACHQAHYGVECGGFLVRRATENPFIVTGATLADGQQVRRGHYKVKPRDVIKAGRAANKEGLRIVGWWHSHGDLDTFFSQLDDEGQMTVLNEIGPSNHFDITEETEISDLVVENEADKTIAYSKRNPRLKWVFKGNTKLDGFSIEEKRRVSFAYGIVVNALAEKGLYAEIATRELCESCNEATMESYVAPMSIIEDIVSLDFGAIRDEVRRKVHFGWGGGFGGDWFSDMFSGPQPRRTYSTALPPPPARPKPVLVPRPIYGKPTQQKPSTPGVRAAATEDRSRKTKKERGLLGRLLLGEEPVTVPPPGQQWEPDVEEIVEEREQEIESECEPVQPLKDEATPIYELDVDDGMLAAYDISRPLAEETLTEEIEEPEEEIVPKRLTRKQSRRGRKAKKNKEEPDAGSVS